MTVRIGLLGVLTIIFVTLKLVGAINWSWWWVLSPVWIPIVLTVVVLISVGLFFAETDSEGKS